MNGLPQQRMWHFVKVPLLYTLIVLELFAVLLAATPLVFAQPSYTINYQGKLTTPAGVAVSNADYDMVFKLYTAPTGGSPIWTETRSAANDVTVTNGLFSVMLGSVSSLASVNFNQTLYLGVTIEADAEMTPRKLLGTVPSAFEAKQLGGVASTSFLRSDTADSASGLLTFTGGLISTASSSLGRLNFTNATGTSLYLGGDRITDFSGTNLEVTGNALGLSSAYLGQTSITTLGTITTGTWTGSAISSTYLDSAVLTASEVSDSAELAALLSDETGFSSGALAVFSISPTITGTADFVSGDFSSTLTMSGSAANIALGSNYLSGDGDDEGLYVSTTGNVGIGTTTPNIGGYSSYSRVLTIKAQAYEANTPGVIELLGSGISNGYNAGELVFIQESGQTSGVAKIAGYRDAGNSQMGLKFYTYGTEKMRIDSSGNIGIGTTTPNQALSIFRSAADSAIEFSSLTGSPYKWTAGIDYSDAGKFKISSSSALGTNDRFVINGAGNVGIGNSSPSQLFSVSTYFTVNSTGETVGTNLQLNSNAGSSDIHQVFRPDLNYIGMMSDHQLVWRSVNTGSFFSAGSVDTGIGRYAAGVVKLTNGSSGDGSIYSGGSANNYFAGNVGIGTTTPASKLQVLSTTEQLRLAYSQTQYWSDTIASDGGRTMAGFGTDADLNFAFGGATDGDFSINTDDFFVDTSTGYIGIGDTTPSAALNIGTGNVSTVDGTNDLFVTDDIEADGDGIFGGVLTTTGGLTIDATTETNIEAAIDTLGSLTSASTLATVGTITSGTWQGTAIDITRGGLGAAFTDPNADQLMFWDDSAAKITGISTLTGASISGTTLTIAVSTSEITDDTITFADINMTAAIGSDPAFAANDTFFGSTGIIFEGGTADAFEGLLTSAVATSDKTWTLPNVTGTIITTGDTGSVTNTMLAGSIAASKLTGTDIATVGTITSGTWNASFSNNIVTPNAVFTTSQTDEYCLTYEATGTTWEWQSCGAGYLTSANIDTSSELDTIVGDNTGSGALVFGTNPTFTGNTVTYSSLTASRALFLGSGSQATTTALSASLLNSLTDETGTGVAVFSTSPVLTTPNLGTPSAITLTSGTGLPISTGLTGAGTGVLTALAVNVGTAGSIVVNGGALGTPSSGTLPLDTLSYTGTIDDTYINDVLSVTGGTIGSNTISAGSTWATAGTLTIGDGADRIDISSNTWDVTNGVFTDVTSLNGLVITANTGVITTGTWNAGVISSTYLDSAAILSTEIDTSSELATILTDETGTGRSVFSASPAFSGTPTFAALSATSTVTLSGLAANIALGSNFISNGGADEGISVGASGNVTISGTLGVTGGLTIDATTETNIEAAIDTLSSLTSVGTIGTGVWQGTDVGVAYGGTGLSTFGGTNHILYTTAADTLSSEAAFTYVPGTDTLTAVNLSLTTGLTFTGVGALNGVDSVDATTESTIESAIDTLGSLTSASTLATVGTITSGTWGGSFSNNIVTPNAVFTTSQTDEYCLTYEATGTTWEWQTCGSGANAALSNLASVAINTSLLPGSNDAIDLGSDTLRFRDLYLGGETLHLGTSITDEGVVSYTTSTNLLNFSTDSTSNGDIAFFSDGLYLDKSSGYVGIGTTTPNQKLTVQGNVNLISPTGALYFDDTKYLFASSTNDSIVFGENAGATFTSNTIYNVALGFEAGRYASSTNGDYNFFGGYQAGRGASGYNNVALGYQAGFNSLTEENILIGTQAGYNNSNLGKNILIGNKTGYNILGSGTIALGERAAYNSSDYDNIVLGFYAGYSSFGDQNIIMGYQAGDNNNGDNNNLIGASAGSGNGGDQNNLIGYLAGYSNTGDFNNIIGSSAGYNNNGDYNDLIGYEVGYNLRSTSTVAIGAQALKGTGAYTSLNNVALGYRAGYVSATGSGNNILIGYQAADNLTTGNNNIVIGYDIDNVTATADNRLNIGNLIFGTSLDGTGTTLASGNIGIGTTTPTAKLDVQGSAEFGTGNVALVTSAGKITGLSTTYFGTDTSSNLDGIITDNTGSGSLVFATSPGFTTAANPLTDDSAALGTSALGWSDLFLATGGTIHFANTDWVATHTTGILTVGTGDLRVTTAGTNAASVVTVGGTQTLTNKTLTSPTVNAATLNGTLTFDATAENNIEALIFDADAETISGAWTVADDVNFTFGTNSDWAIQYDEGVDDQLLFITANTAAIATTDPMVEFLVGTTPTANQQVFGVAKGTQVTNTALFTIDAEGDALVTGTLGVTGGLTIDATTETNIEAAIDTLANLTSVGTIGTGVWQGTDVGVAYGGTGLSTFGGTNHILYTTAADTLSSEAAFTYVPGTDTLTAVNLSLTTGLTFTGVGALNGVDSVDATTEATIEAAIDTLGSLTSASTLATVGTITSGTWGGSFSNNIVTPNAVFTTGQTDEYCLTYETTGTTWAWQSCAGAVTTTEITDDTITFADINMTAAIGSDPAFAANDTFFGSTGIVFEGGTADAFEGLLTSSVATSDKTWTLPNVTGTIVTTGDTGSVTNTMLAGSIAASKLTGTDIATLGTITAGTWTAGVISSTYLDTATLLASELDTCAEFAALGAIETGTCGSLVLSVSPTFTTNITVANDTAGSALTIGRQDNTSEGGQVSFVGAASYDGWTQDSYLHTMRFYTNSANTNSLDISNIGAGVANFSVEGTLTAAGGTISSNLTLSGSTANILLGSNYLSGDGADEGITVDSNGDVGIGTATANGKLTIVNNIATSYLDAYSEYQMITYDAGTAASSYGLGINTNTFVLNSGGGAYRFDTAGTATALEIDTSGNVSVPTSYFAACAGGACASTATADGQVTAEAAITSEQSSLTAGTGIALNWDNSNQQYLSLTTNSTITSFTNNTTGQTIRVVVCQDATGGRTFSFSGPSIKWAGGTAPTQTSTANKCDVYSFIQTTAGTLGAFNQNF